MYIFSVGRQRHTRTSCHGCEEPNSGQIFIYFHNRATNKVHLARNWVVYAYRILVNSFSFSSHLNSTSDPHEHWFGYSWSGSSKHEKNFTFQNWSWSLMYRIKMVSYLSQYFLELSKFYIRTLYRWRYRSWKKKKFEKITVRVIKACIRHPDTENGWIRIRIEINAVRNTRLFTAVETTVGHKPVLGIRIRMVLALLDPDPSLFS